MKKLLLILLCVPLIFSCGDKKDKTDNTENKEIENDKSSPNKEKESVTKG